MVGLYRQILFPLPACYIFYCLFSVLGWYIPQKTNIHTPPGFLGLQSTCSPRLLGYLVMLLDSVLSLCGVGGWMNETRAWSPHSSCWDCSCNFRAFRVSVNLPRNPGPETGCILSRKIDAEEPVCATPKTSETDDCKISVPYSVMLTTVLLTPICITCPQCLFMLRQTIPKGHLKLFFKTIQVPFHLPADCSVHSFIMKMFSPSAIITETENSSSPPIPFWRRVRWLRNHTLHSHLQWFMSSVWTGSLP